jgi:hypothetical protein
MLKTKKREIDLSDFPPGTVTEFTTLVCLACIFDIFTKQLGLAPRTAFSEVKRHTPTIEELTSRSAMRPYFDSDEKNPHCPYCGSAKRWLARFDTYMIEGGKTTDAPRRALMKKLPTAGDQFLVVEKRSDSRTVLFEWLDTLGANLDLNEDNWLLEVTQKYLARREAKTNWEEALADVRTIRRSTRLSEGWERDGARLFLAPNIYGEAILIQYLISRSHAHGGLTSEGRLTLMELLRRLRYIGYLDHLGIIEREPGEVFEKLVDHLASTRDWTRVRTARPSASGRGLGEGAQHSERIKSSSKQTKATKKGTRKSSKSSKSKPAVPEPDHVVTEPVKLHCLIDRRDFLDKVKSVYASYAG